MQDILYDINILNGLFTEKDFEFLKNRNSYENSIESRLKAATKKRDQIIEYKSHYSIGEAYSQETLLALDSAEKAFKNINQIIIRLYHLQENIENIEKSILELIVKKENFSCSEEELKLNISVIKRKISEFEIYSSETDKMIFSNYTAVDEFFNNYYPSGSTDEDINQRNILIGQTSDVQDISDELNIADNPVLRISGKENKVFLPYSKSEILEYLKTYPNVYKDAQDVIEREFIVGLSFYTRHPVLARFRETYALIHDREMKSIVDAFKYAVDLMFKYELNPAIIAGLKSETQLLQFLECLEKNDIDSFKPFKILFEYNPI